MTGLERLFDLALVVGLPVVALAVLTAKELRAAVALFLSLGLLMALVWARLDAPDVALVEAAVGTGLTGALLLASGLAAPAPPQLPGPLAQRLLLAIGLAGLLGAVGLGVATAGGDPGLRAAVLDNLQRSGVTHPPTAVLLNFRGYDTLLEAIVLLVAAVGVGSLRRERPVAIGPPGPLLLELVRWVVPVLGVVAGYLLWRGSDAPGGAFQAGAILAGGGVLLVLAGKLSAPRLASLRVRALLLAGPVAFLAAAALPLGQGGSLLQYPPAWAKALMLGIEVALAGSIAVVLLMFFPALAPARSGR